MTHSSEEETEASEVELACCAGNVRASGLLDSKLTRRQKKDGEKVGRERERKAEGERERERKRKCEGEGSLYSSQVLLPRVPPAEEAGVRGQSVTGLHLDASLICPFLPE